MGVYNPIGATATWSAGGSALTIAGANIDGFVTAGMVIYLGSRTKRVGEGYEIASVTPVGVNGGTINLYDTIAAAGTNQPWRVEFEGAPEQARTTLLTRVMAIMGGAIAGTARLLKLAKASSADISGIDFDIGTTPHFRIRHGDFGSGQRLRLEGTANGGGTWFTIADFRPDGTGGFALGSATAPGISFAGDADTGIYSPGGNQVAVATAGLLRLLVGTTGNVGIGVAAANALLDVGGAGRFIHPTGNNSVTIGGPAGFIRDLIFSTGASARFTWRLNNIAETGSSAGSDLELFRRDDAGLSLARTFWLQRATGIATFESIRLGTGVALLRQLSATASLDFPSIAAGATSSALTITVTGAQVGDEVNVTPPAGLNAGLIPVAWVSATNTVSIRLSNITSGAIDPAAGTFRATVRGY